MAATAGRCIAKYKEYSESSKCTISAFSISRRSSVRLSTHQEQKYELCQLSMNGCQADPRIPLGTVESRTFPAVFTPESAMECLDAAISEMGSEEPPFDSGIIRLEVPIKEQIEAIDWLHGQRELHRFSRCFFSGRSQTNNLTTDAFIGYSKVNSVDSGGNVPIQQNLVSVAGVGSAVYFRGSKPFSIDDWRSIKRFLSKDYPLIRAYGAIRFDATANISVEWKAFGSFYFMIPQIEFDEFEGSSILAATVAWDKTLSWAYKKALAALRSTLKQVSSTVTRLQKEATNTFILSNTYAPNMTCWDNSVKRALRTIQKRNSPLIKVVLARSSRIITSTDIDPLTWLACLQVEGENSYQFCLQPPDAPAFIGNTPEQLFHRKWHCICSDALAGTRARGRSEALDHQIELDLLSSPKDDHEFTVVREFVRRKLEAVCGSVLVEPKKAIRKFPRVQHLYARLTGMLKNEDDEFEILSVLHPTPAVCGFPTEEARVLIAKTETFDRGMYAGPVGWFGGGESEFAVGIRSALVEKEHGALIYAGTGIVEGSISSLEWDELELKTSQFTKLMKLQHITK